MLKEIRKGVILSYSTCVGFNNFLILLVFIQSQLMTTLVKGLDFMEHNMQLYVHYISCFYFCLVYRPVFVWWPQKLRFHLLDFIERIGVNVFHCLLSDVCVAVVLR